MSAREQLFADLYADRVLAHNWLFEERHRDPMPDYQPQLIRDFHDDEKEAVDLVFRGGAKSTIAEEAILIKAGFKEFRFGLIVGNTMPRAQQRLRAITHEVETNPRIEAVFGKLEGSISNADMAMFSNNVMLMALGRGQSMRGVKEIGDRPDFLFGDDLEEWDDVRTQKARDETWRWFTSDLLPALDVEYIARIAATPLDPDALPARLERDGWRTRRIPVSHPHPTDPGKRVSSWPARFPLTREDALAIAGEKVKYRGKRVIMKSIEEREESAQKNGTMRNFRAEYMCEASSPEDQAFTKEMFKDIVERQEPGWQAVYAMFDPARTVGGKSALTGCAVWSWVGPRLIIWECWQKPLMPNQIADAIFDIQKRFHCTILGVEEDGLNQFLMQPLRSEQVKRGVTLPLKAVKAPKGKYDFIRSLQVWFHAREVSFAKALPDLEQALLAFPSGQIDAPNALAYAPVLRGGAPIYGEFSGRNVSAGLEPSPRERSYLALNATRTLVTAVLAQLLDGNLRIYADWVVEGEPDKAVAPILQSARLRAGGAIGLIAPPLHFDQWQNVGLRQAVARVPGALVRGGKPDDARPAVRALLKQEVNGFPALVVSEEARWTLNGFAAGYHHPATKQGTLSPNAEDGVYKVLMEGLESFVGAAQVNSTDETIEGRNYRTDPSGRRYESAMPEKRR